MLYSRNDPYCAPKQARQYAERWQVASVDVGALGHINVDAGLEAWPDGRNLLTAFIAGRDVRSVLAPTPREPPLLDPAR
ncbi:MAG: alpha/beta hydrolase [Nakamurella sp.]